MGALDDLMAQANVPQSNQIEMRPDNRGPFQKAGDFLIGPQARGMLEKLMQEQKYQMDPLVTPLPDANPGSAGYALGSNDIAQDYLGMTPEQHEQFARGETPGSLPFRLRPGQLVFPDGSTNQPLEQLLGRR